MAADRGNLRCAHQVCNYLIHSDASTGGGFCCKKCHEQYVKGAPPQHGKKCEQQQARPGAARSKPDVPDNPNVVATAQGSRHSLPVPPAPPEPLPARRSSPRPVALSEEGAKMADRAKRFAAPLPRKNAAAPLPAAAMVAPPASTLLQAAPLQDAAPPLEPPQAPAAPALRPELLATAGPTGDAAEEHGAASSSELRADPRQAAGGEQSATVSQTQCSPAGETAELAEQPGCGSAAVAAAAPPGATLLVATPAAASVDLSRVPSELLPEAAEEVGRTADLVLADQQLTQPLRAGGPTPQADLAVADQPLGEAEEAPTPPPKRAKTGAHSGDSAAKAANQVAADAESLDGAGEPKAAPGAGAEAQEEDQGWGDWRAHGDSFARLQVGTLVLISGFKHHKSFNGATGYVHSRTADGRFDVALGADLQGVLLRWVKGEHLLFRQIPA